MMSNTDPRFETPIIIYIVRDSVTGGYIVHQYYHMPYDRASAKIYTLKRSATALRNKTARRRKEAGEQLVAAVDRGRKTNPNYTLDTHDQETLADYERRKNLPNYGFEVITITC